MSQLPPTVADHYKRRALGDLILNALNAAGKDTAHLTPDDLAPLDEFHSGQRKATARPRSSQTSPAPTMCWMSDAESEGLRAISQTRLAVGLPDSI